MAKKDIVCPLEEVESEIFASWLEMNQLENSGHIPNETPTGQMVDDGTGKRVWKKGFKSNARNSRMGVTKGLPDFIIVVPAHLCTEDRSILLFVEMKRENGVPSDVKVDQKRWLAALDEIQDVGTFVAFGSKPAMEFVSQFLKNPKKFNF